MSPLARLQATRGPEVTNLRHQRVTLSDFDRLLLHHAVTVVALELLRGRVADTTERRLAGDVLSEIVGGTLSGRELARHRGIRERCERPPVR